MTVRRLWLMVATPALFALCCGGEGRAPADAGAADLAASDAIHDEVDRSTLNSASICSTKTPNE